MLSIALAGVWVAAAGGCRAELPANISQSEPAPPKIVEPIQSTMETPRLDPRRLTHVLTTGAELVSYNIDDGTNKRTTLAAGTKVGVARQWGTEADVTTEDGQSGTVPATVLREVWRVELPDDVAAVSKANNQFACDLYGQLRGGEGNLFFSPLSISTALAMTYAGATGQNEAEMAHVLHFSLPQGQLHDAFGRLQEGLQHDERISGFSLVVANRLWGQRDYRFQPEFLSTTRTHYSAELAALDFRQPALAATEINAWIQKQTRDKIKDLVLPVTIDPQTRLILTNAVYFKADWTEPFKVEDTRSDPFRLLSGEIIDVPLMRKWEVFPFRHEDGFKALEMPYGQEQLSMLLFLPDAADGLAALEAQLTAENVDRWLEEMRRENLEVALPKFKIESTFSLKEALAKLGMVRAFEPQDDNFLGITEETPQWLTDVVHKAYVDVNEQGTEAAAATAVMMAAGSAPVEPPRFIADHPFIFLIRDRLSGAILLCGRVVDPR
jgi:serpin B